jgi:hypothetical protein
MKERGEEDRKRPMTCRQASPGPGSAAGPFRHYDSPHVSSPNYFLKNNKTFLSQTRSLPKSEPPPRSF